MADSKDGKESGTFLKRMNENRLITNYKAYDFAEAVVQFRQIVTVDNGLYQLKNNERLGSGSQSPSLLRIAKEFKNNKEEHKEKFSSLALEKYIKARSQLNLSSDNKKRVNQKYNSLPLSKIIVTKSAVLLDSLNLSSVKKTSEII